MPDTNDTLSFSGGATGTGAPFGGALQRPRHMGAVIRLLCHIAAVNPERLAKCPLDDWQATARTAIALIASYLFTTATVTGALAIAFGLHGARFAMAVPIAALVTAAVVLVDQAIIQAHWLRAGADQARARGFMPDGRRGAGLLRRLFTFCFRLALSGALAFVVAGFVQLLVFSHDIARQMAESHRARNALVFNLAEQRVDAEIALRDGEVAAMAHEHARATARYDDTLRETTAAHRTQAAAREARLVQLRESRDAQLTEAQRQRNHAVYEENGTTGADYQSGGRGKDVRYKTAIALAEQAEARARDLQAEIVASQSASPDAALGGVMDIAAAHQEIEQISERRRALSAERDAMVIARNAAVLSTAQADPRFVPMPEGLFAEWLALDHLTNEPGARVRTLGINLLIMLVELAGVLVRTMVVSPSLYSVRTAAVFEVDAADTVARAERSITGSAEMAGEARETREVMHDERDQRRNRRQNVSHLRQKFGDELF